MADAWIAATLVAVAAGAVGFFTVLRGSTFAAHALPQGAFAGAAGASLLGLSTVLGLAVFAVAGALGIGALSRRARNDVATALAFVFMLGLGALFLSRSVEYAPEIYSLLFGEVLGVSPSELVPTAALAAVSVGALLVLYRPLLLSSVDPQLAEARGVGNRRMEICFLLLVAVVTALSVPVVGALLTFSLMVGPPAAARSFTASPVTALGLSVLLALATVWTAIAASYLTNLPIGFYVGVVGAVVYLAGRAWAFHRLRRRGSGGRPTGVPAAQAGAA
jgi:zinc/manganese transport system permease protein